VKRSTDSSAGARPSASGTNTDLPGGPGDAPAKSSNRSAILRSGFLVGLLFVVFGLILPRFVDYGAVLTALQALTPEQLLLMSALSVISYFVSGLLLVAVLPGLDLLRGTAAFLIITGIGTSIPFGPWNLGVTWLVLRGWGFPNQQTVSGIALYGLLSWLARLALPPLVVVLLLARDELDGPGRRALPIAFISGAVFIGATVVIFAILRSQRIANWLG